MRPIALAAALWMAAAASAQDARLNALHASLVTLHAHAKEASAVGLGGRPELTVIKHELRDWIETQLASLKVDGDEKAFADRINKSLKAMSVVGAAESQNLLGSLGDVSISREADILIVTTRLGILCQYDDSVYAYGPAGGGGWQRLWESEQNDYSPKKYNPQHIMAVHVSRLLLGGPPFIMTLGNEWGCASTWHSVYYRVWRVDPSGAKLLIDDSATAWLRTPTYAVGSIGRDRTIENAPVDVLIEFTERSIDVGVHNREAVRHFLIDGDQVRRVDPVALSPRDFVDEWLTSGWNESAAWSASPTLKQWHQRLRADFVAGQFDDTMHCETPDLSQVTFEPHNAKDFAPEPSVYFLVRWRPPYHFTMMDISDKPWPRCTQEDREADEWRTLFNTQEWRW
jgi:hypothetical protein